MRARSLLLPVLAALVVLGAALALRRNATGPTAPSRVARVAYGAVRVQIKDFAYSPASLTVRVGTKVTWTNLDQTAHTATANDGSFDTGTIEPGASRSIVFRRPGRFAYHCAFHGFMTATITVVG